MINTKTRVYLGICILGLFVTADAAQTETGIVDTPIPVFNTKIVIAEKTGEMLWLDSNTLAITTYLEDTEYWNGKIVAVDINTRTTQTLLERGFLQCAHSDGLVAVQKGSLVREFWGPEKEPSAPKPAQVFFRWNPEAKELQDEEPTPKQRWNWFICTQTQEEDINQPSFGFYVRTVRYLEPRDGVLRWNRPGSPRDASPVMLERQNSVPKATGLVSTEIALVPKYFHFGDHYLLTLGRFTTGSGRINYLGKMVDQLPAITMTREGRVNRSFVPKELKSALDLLGTNDGQTVPTAAGLLVHVNGWVEGGGGLYLSGGNTSKRIWCTPTPGRVEPCTIEAWALSPNGCNLAFVPQRDFPKTVKVIRLCSSKGEK